MELTEYTRPKIVNQQNGDVWEVVDFADFISDVEFECGDHDVELAPLHAPSMRVIPCHDEDGPYVLVWVGKE